MARPICSATTTSALSPYSSITISPQLVATWAVQVAPSASDAAGGESYCFGLLGSAGGSSHVPAGGGAADALDRP